MFTIKEILEATGGKLIRGKIKNRVGGVSIDSRTIKAGELFVAIKGTRFDGHGFIAQAIHQGAGAILFAKSYLDTSALRNTQDSIPMIAVQDTVAALGALAHYHRRRFPISVIAITGSNGKTTTKEMLSRILSQRFNVLRNPGTQNNLIGVPLAIFRLRKKHQLAVVEIGANRPGEIDRLSWIIQPSIGIITNIGPAHLQSFKSLHGVLKAKLELIKNLSPGAKLIVNGDDRFLSRLSTTNLQIVTFGLNPSSDFYVKIVHSTAQGTSILLNERHYITLKVLGRHNVYNALAGIACARIFGLSFKEIREALASFGPLPLRTQIFKVKNIKIINDCYNANPESLECALNFLQEFPAHGKKIVVCGDMLELGGAGQRLHLHMGKRIAKKKVDVLITVGDLAKNIALGAREAGMLKKSIRLCQTNLQAAKYLHRLARAGDVVLIKGSRAMQMENILRCFINFFIP